MRKLSAFHFQFSTPKGVTLIELLIVIGVIGILASVLLFYINPVVQFQKARDTNRKTDLAQIQATLEFYRSDLGYYPLASILPACGSAFIVSGTTYLQSMPCDPLDKVIYSYTPLSSSSPCNNTSIFCTTYILFACLENVRDPAADAADGAAGDRCGASGRVSYTVRNP